MADMMCAASPGKDSCQGDNAAALSSSRGGALNKLTSRSGL